MRAMPARSAAASVRSRSRPARSDALRAAIVVFAGIAASLHVGKLPPALPVLQSEFGLSLVQVSWMVSLFVLGPALIGVFAGSLADRFDARASMISGLLFLSASGTLGAFAPGAGLLLFARALESIGFMMIGLPGPALIAAIVPPSRVRAWLGVWSTYMPAGMGAALFAGPATMSVVGWRGVWLACAGLAALAAALLAFVHPAPARASGGAPDAPAPRIGPLVRQTLRSPGPWLLGTCFLFYAGQFMAIFSFLPSIYQDAGLSAQWSATLTAFAVIVSMIGNVGAGFLLQHGVGRSSLVVMAGLAMAACAWLAFGSTFGFGWRYAGVVLFAIAAGVIPGTLFATVPFFAPSQAAISTTVGMMQQGSSLGQLLLPPAVAAFAVYAGWNSIWIATGAAAMVTVALGAAMARTGASAGERERPGCR